MTVISSLGSGSANGTIFFFSFVLFCFAGRIAPARIATNMTNDRWTLRAPSEKAAHWPDSPDPQRPVPGTRVYMGPRRKTKPRQNLRSHLLASTSVQPEVCPERGRSCDVLRPPKTPPIDDSGHGLDRPAVRRRPRSLTNLPVVSNAHNGGQVIRRVIQNRNEGKTEREDDGRRGEATRKKKSKRARALRLQFINMMALGQSSTRARGRGRHSA